MNLELALRKLDKHASEFNFPVLDNAYVEMAATRLTAFRDAQDWAIAFEVVGYSTNEGSFVNDLYAFGSCLQKEGFIGSRAVMSQSPNDPLIDPHTEAWIADWEHWAIVVKGKCHQFAPSRDEYVSAGIDVPLEGGPGSLSEGQIMRFFIHRESAQDLLMRDSELRDAPKMSVFLQTQEWQHPDVAGEERPSEKGSLRSLLAALESNSPALFQLGRPNTDWRVWNATRAE